MNDRSDWDRRGLVEGLVGDGRALLMLVGVSLIMAGGVVLFQATTGHFLPHDEQFLGMTARDLCRLNECRIVHFMIHDRVAFGGSIIAVGALYLWLAEFPLKRGEAWAWWAFVISGVIGFGSFLTYLGYGYLDTWHGAATLPLLACYGWGLWRSFGILDGPRHVRSLLRAGERAPWASAYGVGRGCLMVTAAALVGGGLTIMAVGMTSVFVPQDLEFMGVTAAELHAVNPRLVPLIAHDRAGFGGGLCCTGITVFFCVWCGPPSRNLWQVLCASGTVGFGTAIGVHPSVGYNSVSHLAPAVVAAGIFVTGLALTYGRMMGGASSGHRD
jgi:hypothetical protein